MYKLILILTFLSLPALGLDDFEKIALTNELTTVCKLYNHPCTVVFNNNSKWKQAYTTRQGELVFTKAMIDTITYEQARAVGLHEAGHHILEHYKKLDEFIDNWTFKAGHIKKFRHQQETQADLFATKIMLDNGLPNSLPDALTNIIPPEKFNDSTDLHPSGRTRVENIKNFTIEYNRLNTPPVIYTKPYYIPSQHNTYDWSIDNDN